MNSRIRRSIFGVAAILWMIMIFCFSAQVAEESSELSGGFIELIMSFFGVDITAGENTELADMLSFIVRKCAHFTEYTILAILLVNALDVFKYYGAIAFITGALYSVSDELHQYFVPGRSCELRDVCIDSSGVLLGCVICYAFKMIKKRKRG